MDENHKNELSINLSRLPKIPKNSLMDLKLKICEIVEIQDNPILSNRCIHSTQVESHESISVITKLRIQKSSNDTWVKSPNPYLIKAKPKKRQCKKSRIEERNPEPTYQRKRNKIKEN